MAPFYNDDSDDEYEPSQVPLHYHFAASGFNKLQHRADDSEMQLDESKVKIEHDSETKVYSPAEVMDSPESRAGNHRRKSARLEVNMRGGKLTKDLFGPGGALDSQTSNTQYVSSLLSNEVQDPEEMEQRRKLRPPSRHSGSTADHSESESLRYIIHEQKLTRAAKIHRRLAEVHTTMSLLHNELAHVLDDASGESVEKHFVTSSPDSRQYLPEKVVTVACNHETQTKNGPKLPAGNPERWAHPDADLPLKGNCDHRENSESNSEEPKEDENMKLGQESEGQLSGQEEEVNRMVDPFDGEILFLAANQPSQHVLYSQRGTSEPEKLEPAEFEPSYGDLETQEDMLCSRELRFYFNRAENKVVSRYQPSTKRSTNVDVEDITGVGSSRGEGAVRTKTSGGTGLARTHPYSRKRE
ncbi:hypothetical protein K474DRAFT_1774741 [Panus rudis PR-1116 ss-1]|nr:hypothetical protein K474DRAFT_1774741 [Panus rudis PR-1116 ss-1]